MATKRIAQIDLETGEILEGNIAWLPSKKGFDFKENWMIVFQEALAKIAKMKISKSAQRVLMILLSEMAYENYILISQADIARVLEISKGNVSDAIKELKEIGVIVTSNKTPGRSLAYRINSHYAWRGTPEKFAKVRPLDPR